VITVYISIGNSDDKLSQVEWAAYAGAVRGLIRRVESVYSGRIHGDWTSLPFSPYQNACWCIEIPDEATAETIRRTLANYAGMYRQDSIAWAVAETEFIGPAS
jgi:hypothetical protein